MRPLLVLLCWCLVLTCEAQYFQFSQFNFTKQRISPAYVASSNYASVSLVSRDQATEGNFHINSNFFSASYPLINKKGKRWSGIGISLMDDRSGTAGIFNTQEAALSYAVNLSMSKSSSLAVGFKALYHSQGINTDGLYTGSQYVPDRGFNEGLASGEDASEYRNSFTTFSAGMHWQENDKQGNRLVYFSLSFFDFNKPENSFIGPPTNLSSTLVASGALKVYDRGKISVSPELLLTSNALNNVFNFGAVTTYSVMAAKNKVNARIDFITKYVLGRSGILGIQLHKENFSVGFSYDFPVAARNPANTSAFEIGLELRRLVVPKKKTPTITKKPVKPTSTAKATTPRDTTAKAVRDSSRVGQKPVVAMTDMSERLRHKQDSVKAQANVGVIKHEPLILEKATLHFNFTFGSFEIGESEGKYLDELAIAFKDNPDLKIRLVGHTDDVGADKFNTRLSVQRAEKIRDFLVERGVAADRIAVDGKGEREPVTVNTTEEGRSKNRRVELEIMYDQ